MFFIFNGINSRDIGLKVKEFPFDIMPQKRYKEMVLDRFDGTVYTDLGTYESITFDVECLLVDNFTVEDIKRIKDVFKVGGGEIIFSHKPDHIFEVKIINSINFISMLEKTGSCIISFKSKPFSYLKSGSNYSVINSGVKLNNLGNDYSFPQFRVVPSNSRIEITVNDKKMVFINATKPFIIDCNLEDVYGADDSELNLNNYMDINSDFVRLVEGVNNISFSGASKVEIKPNWRVI